MALKTKDDDKIFSLNRLNLTAKNPLFVFGSSIIDRATAYENCHKMESYFAELSLDDVLFVDIPMSIDGFHLLLTSLYSHRTVILGHHYLSDTQKKFFHDLPEVTHVLHGIDDRIVFEPLIKKTKKIPSTSPYIGVLSSGTTQTPKCIRHNLDTLTHSLSQNRYDNKTWFCSYPLTHYAGLQVLIKTLISEGTLIVSCPSVQEDVNNMIKYQCSYLNCTPSYLRKLLSSLNKEKLKQLSIEVITLGGEQTDQTLLDKLNDLFPNTNVFHIYASTELGPVFLIKDKKEGFPSAWIDNKQAKLSDAGELVIKKKSSSMRGYSHQQDQLDEWFGTGDLITIKGDRALLTGRIDDVVNVGGYKINPLDVEKIIMSMNGVVDVLVHGIHNPVLGSLVEALVQLDSSVNPLEMKSTINDKCHALLSQYAGPHILRFVDEIPLSSVGKKIRLNYKGNHG